MVRAMALFGRKRQSQPEGDQVDSAGLDVPPTAEPEPIGVAEYRAALRDGIEKTSKLVGTNGVYSMAAGDHAGYDASAIVMIKVENNHWKLVK